MLLGLECLTVLVTVVRLRISWVNWVLLVADVLVRLVWRCRTECGFRLATSVMTQWPLDVVVIRLRNVKLVWISLDWLVLSFVRLLDV